MTASYIAYHPEQQQLLPSALQDWLPQGHLAYFTNDTVDSLNLSSFHARYGVEPSTNPNPRKLFQLTYLPLPLPLARPTSSPKKRDSLI